MILHLDEVDHSCSWSFIVTSLMAGQSQRWGYVQPQQLYQHQLGRSDSIISTAGLDQSAAALDILSSPTTFTAAVSLTTTNGNMLPSLSSSSSSSSSSMSDSDATLMMETAKIDPLDLTCNSHQNNAIRSTGPAASTIGAGQHSRVTDSPLGDKSSSSSTARNMLLFNNDCDMDQQRSRVNSNNNSASMIPPTGAVGPALPVSGATSSNGANAEEAHRCDMCGKTFAVPARLTRHYRTHTGIYIICHDFSRRTNQVGRNKKGTGYLTIYTRTRLLT